MFLHQCKRAILATTQTPMSRKLLAIHWQISRLTRVNRLALLCFFYLATMAGGHPWRTQHCCGAKLKRTSTKRNSQKNARSTKNYSQVNMKHHARFTWNWFFPWKKWWQLGSRLLFGGRLSCSLWCSGRGRTLADSFSLPNLDSQRCLASFSPQSMVRFVQTDHRYKTCVSC